MLIIIVSWFIAIILAIATTAQIMNSEKKKTMLFLLLGSITLFFLGIWLIVASWNSLMIAYGIISIIAAILLLILRGAKAHNWDTTWNIAELFKTSETDNQ